MKKYLYLLLSAALLIVLTSPLRAANLTVIPGTGDDCSDGQGSFQNCLNFAGTNGQDDTILVQPGTYSVSSTLTYFFPTETFSLTIKNATSTLPVITSGNTVECMALETDLPANNVSFSISGLVFQQCSAPSGSDGGALEIFSLDGNLSVDNCTFTDNHANTDDAGALKIKTNVTGNISVTNSQFTGNSCGVSGGGLFALTEGSGNITVQGNQFTGNTAGDGGGAAVGLFSGLATVSDNVIQGNQSARTGGGLTVLGESGSMVVVNNVITGNQAGKDPSGSLLGADGGGIFFFGTQNNGTLTATNNTIFNNVAQGNGGGISVVLDLASNTANLYNNIVFGNNASGDGEEIFSDEDSGKEGDGGTMNVFNNDFAANGFFSVCSSGGTTCAGVHGLSPDTNIHASPLFVDSAANDFSLQSTSPCIDTGDPTAPQMPSTDFNGNPRPAKVGTNPDIGALEFQPIPTPTPVPPSSGGCSLTAGMESSFGGIVIIFGILAGFFLATPRRP